MTMERLGSNREDFIKTWLTEMPQGIPSMALFNELQHAIKERIKLGSEVIDLGNNLRKIMGQQIVFYWYEKDGVILLCAELEIRPQGLIVDGVAKNPDISGSPYATDLYSAILNDSGKAIKLIGDGKMTSDGLQIWKKLLSMGHVIGVYDQDHPGQSFTILSSETDLDRFFSMDDIDFQKYRFVLSESNEMIAETNSYFTTRRMRELVSIQTNTNFCE